MKPQLATLVETPPSGPEWIHEIKFDGYRAICELSGGAGRVTKVLTRSGLDWTHKFTWLARACAELGKQAAVLDGEICFVEENGRTNFGRLQESLEAGSAGNGELTYFAFDLLSLGGKDLRERPLLERKEKLKKLLAKAPASIQYSEHWKQDGGDLLRAACGLSLEGLISKRVDATYEEGRSKSWLKSKCKQGQEFVIGGFVRSDAGLPFRSLLLGTYKDGELVYAGRVGTGFNRANRDQIAKQLRSRLIKKSPFAEHEGLDEKQVVWCRPDLVANVEFAEWTSSGVLRHPSFQGLREDKKPKEVKVEKPRARRAVAAARATSVAKRSSPISVTHPEREVIDGTTKADLARYYAIVAPLLLPHVNDRPLSLLRCPSASKCFFQKHAHSTSLRSRLVRGEEGEVEVLTATSAGDLVDLVQNGVVELHAWGTDATDLDRPNLLIFDLDPGPGVTWDEIKEAAEEVRDFLKAMKLASFAKTTGGKGLHLHVPIERDLKWEKAKAFAKAVAQTLAKRKPERYTANIAKAARPKKIFVDYLRNGYGATAVVPYSVRARAGAPVAWPLSWKELAALDDPQIFNVASALGGLVKKRMNGESPWPGYSEVKQRLPRLS